MEGYQPIAFDGFGKGLNLRDKVDAVDPAEAIDCLNVVFSVKGSVEQRAGFQEFTASALTNPVDSMAAFYKSAGTRQLMCGCGTRLEAVDTAGAVVDSETGLAGGPYTFARFGAPNAEVAYAGNGTDTLRKWDGTTWTAPTATVDGTAGRAMPKAGAVCLMPADNRLVATGYATTTGGPHGTTSSPSHVYFSTPGLPETWETDGTAGRGRNFVQLTPGDGERIMAAVAWRELVFIFKETKFFVFYGNSVAQDGTPVFNYRVVDNGQGLASARAIAVARDGVYFMSRRGVYRTTGGEPQLVSSLIDPIWLGSASSYFESGVLNHAEITDCAMTWHDERIYLAYPSGTATAPDRLLVYDTQLEWWAPWDFEASCLTPFRVGAQTDLVFGYSSGTNDIGRHVSSATSDAGVAITSRWRSGWADFGSTVVKTIRETQLAGTGQMTMDISHDYQSSGQAVPIVFTVPSLWEVGGPSPWEVGGPSVWGPSTQVTPRQGRKAVRGTTFSTRFRNSTLDRSWSLNRLAHHVREQRITSVLAPE